MKIEELVEKYRKASGLQPCLCHLVFKLFFASSKMLWAHMYQKKFSS